MVGMEGELTLPEYLNVLKYMSNGKSPGLDGFSNEFYKLFWIDIQEYVIKSLNFAYEKSFLSVSQKTRVNYLLTEGGKAKTFVNKLASDIFIKCRLQNRIGLYFPKG
jgi:hypothetical protein